MTAATEPARSTPADGAISAPRTSGQRRRRATKGTWSTPVTLSSTCIDACFKACLSCRARKVRCNVVQQAPNPCTNCQLDRTQCITPHKASSFPSVNKQTSNVPQIISFPTNDNRSGESERQDPVVDNSNSIRHHHHGGLDGVSGGGEYRGFTMSPVVTNKLSDQASMPPTALSELEMFDLFIDRSPTSMNLFPGILDLPTAGESIDSGMTQRSISDDTTLPVHCDLTKTMSHDESRGLLPRVEPETESPTICISGNGPQGEPIAHFRCSCDPSCQPHIPWIARWCIGHLDEYTRLRIRETEALRLPPSDVIHSLLESYFLYVNCYTPCVSEWETYRLIHNDPGHDNQQRRPMSLALLNAIMFAASGVRFPRVQLPA
jgi:hypothetical protein